MIKRFVLGLFLGCLFLVTVSWALDLKSAKQLGCVGEQLDGYIGIVQDKSGCKNVSSLVKDTNQKRMNYYNQIAADTNVERQAVEVRAGQRLTKEKFSLGEYVKNAEGEWVKGP